MKTQDHRPTTHCDGYFLEPYFGPLASADRWVPSASGEVPKRALERYPAVRRTLPGRTLRQALGNQALLSPALQLDFGGGLWLEESRLPEAQPKAALALTPPPGPP